MYPNQNFNNSQNNINNNNLSNSSNITYNKNCINLLSIINAPILVQEHNHPFVYCYTIERPKHGDNWFCNKCQNVNLFNVPSFYCIFCDCDFFVD